MSSSQDGARCGYSLLPGLLWRLARAATGVANVVLATPLGIGWRGGHTRRQLPPFVARVARDPGGLVARHRLRAVPLLRLTAAATVGG